MPNVLDICQSAIFPTFCSGNYISQALSLHPGFLVDSAKGGL